MRDQRDTGKTRIYISHHHSPYEDDFTARLEADLSAARADVRTDNDSVTRDAFVQVILEGRPGRQFFLVVITPDAVASPFVLREVSVALRERAAGRILAVIPIFLLPTAPDEIPPTWLEQGYIDATHGYDPAHLQLMAALELTGPNLSDPMATSDATNWTRSNPGVPPSDHPSQDSTSLNERADWTNAPTGWGEPGEPITGWREAGEPDTGPLPPISRADEPDTGPLPPPASSTQPPAADAPETTGAPPAQRDRGPGGSSGDGVDEESRGMGGHADTEASAGSPLGGAPAEQAPTQPPLTEAPTPPSQLSADKAAPDATQESSTSYYGGSLWDILPSATEAPTTPGNEPAAAPDWPSEDQERAGPSTGEPAPLPPSSEPDAPEPPLSGESGPAEKSAEAAPADQQPPVDMLPAQPPQEERSQRPIPPPTPWPAPAPSPAPPQPPAAPEPAPLPSQPGADRGASGRAIAGDRAPVALERVAFTAYHPKEVERAKPAPLLVYLALDDAAALAQVAAQAAERLAGRLDQYRGSVADERLTLRRGAKLRIIPTIPGFHVNPQWMDVTWDEDAQQHEFSIRADSAPTGRAAEGAVRVYQGLTLRAEVPVSIFVSPGAGAALTPNAYASAVARAYRRVFASYSHRDTPVVESCEAAAEAMGDRYLRDVMTLQSGQLWNSQLMKMITEADVFQLFWSKNASHSGYVRQEWEYALTLQANRPGFIRPVYWTAAPVAIPAELNPLHFEPLDLSALGWGPVRRFFYLMQS